MFVKPKYTVINSRYDENTHMAFVTISTDCGLFAGTATCHKRDYEWESKIFGCEIAEIRAGIKYMKEKRRHAVDKYKMMKEYYHIVSGMTGFDAKVPAMSKARKMIYACNDEIMEYDKLIKAAYETITLKCQLMEKTMKKLKPRTN